MRALVQRVTEARVRIDGDVVGEIGNGLCVLVGVTHDDTEAAGRKLADKVWHLRVFDDADGTMNEPLGTVGGAALVVSQFTLIADTAKGHRPSFTDAAPPERAEPLYGSFCTALRELGVEVSAGRFGARMAVELVNDGPVTIVLE